MQKLLSDTLVYLSPAVFFAAVLIAALIFFFLYYRRHVPQGIALSPDGTRPHFSFVAPLTPMT